MPPWPFHQRWFGPKVIQRPHSGHHWCQRRRNLRIGGVGEMCLAVHYVFMNGGMEGLFHLRHVSGKNDHVARLGYLLNRESLRLQPCRDRVQVRVTHAKTLAILCWSEPLAVVRRCRVLCVAQELLQGNLL